jgi:hypothetical protein
MDPRFIFCSLSRPDWVWLMVFAWTLVLTEPTRRWR